MEVTQLTDNGELILNSSVRTLSTIPNFLLYNDGRVFNVKTGRFIYGTTNKNGYLQVALRGKTYLLHRVIASAFIPNPNNLPVVNHIDGNRRNNDVTNLEWCSQLYNAQSINTLKRFGCVRITKNGRYQAHVRIHRRNYNNTFRNREDAQDYLDMMEEIARRTCSPGM